MILQIVLNWVLKFKWVYLDRVRGLNGHKRQVRPDPW